MRIGSRYLGGRRPWLGVPFAVCTLVVAGCDDENDNDRDDDAEVLLLACQAVAQERHVDAEDYAENRCIDRSTVSFAGCLLDAGLPNSLNARAACQDAANRYEPSEYSSIQFDCESGVLLTGTIIQALYLDDCEAEADGDPTLLAACAAGANSYDQVFAIGLSLACDETLRSLGANP